MLASQTEGEWCRPSSGGAYLYAIEIDLRKIVGGGPEDYISITQYGQRGRIRRLATGRTRRWKILVVGEFVGWLLGELAVGEFVRWLLGELVVGEFVGWLLGEVVVGEFVGWLLGELVVGEFVGSLQLGKLFVGEIVGWILGAIGGFLCVWVSWWEG